MATFSSFSQLAVAYALADEAPKKEERKKICGIPKALALKVLRREKRRIRNAKEEKKLGISPDLGQKIRRASRFIKRCVDALDTQEHYVFLGRDSWPMFLLAQARGLSCQYFLFSRLQLNRSGYGCSKGVDESTQTQWLKEVPRDSIVIDTGFAGSIIDAIGGFDKTVRGMLMSSSGKYPTIVENCDHSSIVGDIEHISKLVNKRSVGYSKGGQVVWQERVRYGGDRDHNSLTVAQRLGIQKYILHTLGLSQSLCNFTGSTPKERLMMNNTARQEWYRKVSHSRGFYDNYEDKELGECPPEAGKKRPRKGFTRRAWKQILGG